MNWTIQAVRVVIVIVLTLALSAIGGRIPLSESAGSVVIRLAHWFGSGGIEDTMDLYLLAVTLLSFLLSLTLVWAVGRRLRRRRTS